MSSKGARMVYRVNTIIPEHGRERVAQASGSTGPDGVDTSAKLLTADNFAHVWIGLMLAQSLRVLICRMRIAEFVDPPESSERLERLPIVCLPECGVRAKSQNATPAVERDECGVARSEINELI